MFLNFKDIFLEKQNLSFLLLVIEERSCFFKIKFIPMYFISYYLIICKNKKISSCFSIFLLSNLFLILAELFTTKWITEYLSSIVSNFPSYLPILNQSIALYSIHELLCRFLEDYQMAFLWVTFPQEFCFLRWVRARRIARYDKDGHIIFLKTFVEKILL